MNEELAGQLVQNDVDYFANIILKEKQMRNDIVELTLNHPHIMVYYHGYYILDKATEINPKIFYMYWEDFVKILNHKNTAFIIDKQGSTSPKTKKKSKEIIKKLGIK